MYDFCVHGTRPFLLVSLTMTGSGFETTTPMFEIEHSTISRNVLVLETLAYSDIYVK